MFHTDVIVLKLPGNLLRLCQKLRHPAAGIQRTSAALYLWQFVEFFLHIGSYPFCADLHVL